MNYSILMSVYKNDNAIYFEEAIESMLSQTVKSNDFVIVCDGPLTDDLNKVIFKYENNTLFNIIRLETNQGLGNALNIALPKCINELVARMDSDDISLPNRIKLQIDSFKNDSELSVVSGTIIEFDLELMNKLSVKKLPENNLEIINFSKKRNPVNHPTVMFKKSSVLNVGGYKTLHLFEDYYLWVRMIISGYKFYNIQEPLLNMRSGLDQVKRRGGYKYFKSAKKLQKYMYQNKFISFTRYYKNLIIRFITAVLMPNSLRNYFYKKALRK